jgi:hypothetical protein
MLKIGDSVNCRLYNSVERRFYGNSFTGKIIDVDKEYFVNDDDKRGYLIQSNHFGFPIWMKRKEVKGIRK